MSDEKKRRYGPEPMSPDQVRDRRLSVYVTGPEHDEIVRRADLVGMRPTGYMRAAALDRLPPTIPALNRAAWVELSRAASNLYLIARAAHGPEAVQALEARAVLDEFRAALIGAQPSGGEDDES